MKKSPFNLIFISAGTILLAAMLVVMTVNFLSDARVLKKPLLTLNSRNSANSADKSSKAPDNGFKTIKVEENDKPKPSTPKKATSPAQKSPDKVKIEVINYSGDEMILEEATAGLKAAGFDVTGSNASKQDTGTLIILRNGTVTGDGIKKILKTGRVVSWLDPKSTFDITVKLGLDYSP